MNERWPQTRGSFWVWSSQNVMTQIFLSAGPNTFPGITKPHGLSGALGVAECTRWINWVKDLSLLHSCARKGIPNGRLSSRSGLDTGMLKKNTLAAHAPWPLSLASKTDCEWFGSLDLNCSNC